MDGVFDRLHPSPRTPWDGCGLLSLMNATAYLVICAIAIRGLDRQLLPDRRGGAAVFLDDHAQLIRAYSELVRPVFHFRRTDDVDFAAIDGIFPGQAAHVDRPQKKRSRGLIL
jgi:hypothetical protein